MKVFFHKTKSLPTATSVQERIEQELQLLVDALVEKASALGFTVNITFNKKDKLK